MRKLIVVAAGLLTALTALPLYAAEVTFGGEFRVRAFMSENIQDGDNATDVSALGINDAQRFNDLRFRLRTAIKAGVTIGVIVLDFGNCYGGVDVSSLNGGAAVVPGTGGSQTGDCRFGQAGLGRSFNVVGVHEAHLNIDLGRLDLLLGRQTLKLGHGIVFDDTGDAITLIYDLGEGKTLTGSLIQIVDTGDALGVPGAGNDDDSSIWLVNLGMDHKEHVINIYDAIIYDQAAGSTLAPTVGNYIYPTGVSMVVPLVGFDKLWVNFLGVSVDATRGAMNLALEGSYSVGRIGLIGGGDHHVGGWNLMGDVTLDQGGMEVGGTVLVASGQDSSDTLPRNIADISGNVKFGNILLNNEMNSDRDGGSMGGGLGGAGLLGLKLHASTTPSDKLTVGGAVIYAWTLEEPSQILPNAVPPPLGIVTRCVTCSREVGLELDANAAYAVDSNMTISAGAGVLFPGDGAENFYTQGVLGGGHADPIWKLSGRAVFTF